MAKMFLMAVDKEGVEVEANNIQDMYKLVECDYLDSQTIFYNGNDRIVVWVDDEGLIVNKKRNRGYSGNVLVSKVNEDGEDIDLTDEDIKNVIDILDKKPKIESNLIKHFLDEIDYLLPEPTLETFHYDDINLTVSVSSNDIINSLMILKKRETIEMIEHCIATVLLGRITIEQLFSDLSKSYAEAIYLQTKENSFYSEFFK